MIPSIERLPKPDWCETLETFVRNAVAHCRNATLFGSWACGEETLLLRTSDYYVLSDIDVSFADAQASDVVRTRIAKVIPEIRVDRSDASAFPRSSQTRQRLLAPGGVLSTTIEKEEIAEAIAIRIFYSSLDIWSATKNGDIDAAVYSILRMVAEIPLYHCWNCGLICGSYRTQLEIAVAESLLTQLDGFDLIKFCVQCKGSVLLLQQDPDEREVECLLDKCIGIFEQTIEALEVGDCEHSIVCRDLLACLNRSMTGELTLDLPIVASAWTCYSESVADASVRNKYLLDRIGALWRDQRVRGNEHRSRVSLPALQAVKQGQAN